MNSNTHRLSFYCLLVFCSLIFTTGVQAKKMPVQSNRIWNGDLFATNASVSASLSSPCSTIESLLDNGTLNTHRVKNRIIFGVSQSCPPTGPCSTYQPDPYVVDIVLTVTHYKIIKVGTDYQCVQADPNTVCMSVEYRPDGMYIDKSVYEFEGGVDVDVDITSITVRSPNTSPAMNIYLELELEEERIYNFSPGTSSLISGVTDVYSTQNEQDGEVEISWTAADWAEEYELEWTYVDDYGITSNRTQIAFTENDFRFNSTRITTMATSYKIPLVYGKGFLVYRVRGLGNPFGANTTVFMPGMWSPVPTSTANQVGHFAYFDITDEDAEHEDFLNWQFSASYAEEGKSKVTVNYFDGSLRSRQMVTKAKTDNTTVVGETIYDHQGRAAINVLPVPSMQTKIQYHNLFNLNTNSLPYNKEDFDLDDQQEPCTASPGTMSNSSGAEKYYSFQRLSMGNTTYADNYLPKSFGFPFTQTVFTPDNTGRIRSQSGPGNELRIGSGKETKYFYGKPFQEELDQLFGYEAGDALHYKKNMVFDPNGQVSISYLDPAGKVVATSLTGSLPGNVSALTSQPNGLQDPLSFDLLNKTRPTDNTGSENILDLQAGTLTVSRELLLDKDGVRSFGYYLEGNKFSMPCTTETQTSICYNCVLDLEISLKDVCGTELMGTLSSTTGNKYTLGLSILESIQSAKLNATSFNPSVSCSNETVPLLTFSKGFAGNPRAINQSWTTTTSLSKGSYTLNKVLRVNHEALDFYTQHYLNSTCLTPLSTFITQEMAKIDFTACDNNMTCEACSTQVGERSLYENPANDNQDCGEYPCLTDDQYNMLLAQCAELCQDMACKSMLAGMKSDMNLHGQYGAVLAQPMIVNGAAVNLPRFTEYNPYLHPLSVFNEANLLPLRKVKGVLRFPNWRFPYDGSYKDASGQLSYVRIIKNPENGTFSPAILPNAEDKLILVDEEENLYKIAPQFLRHVTDFIKNWNNNWVNSLVQYHPEYGYYLFCKELEKSGSNAYDNLLLNQETYVGSSHADFTKLMMPLGTIFGTGTTCNINTSLTPNDPLFVSGSNNSLYNVEDVRAMQNAMCNYTLIPVSGSVSIWELAYKLAYCPKSIQPGGSSACSTCTMPFVTVNGVKVPDFGTGANADKAWQIFRMLYLSLKQRLTEKKAAAAAILYTSSYSECIGNPNFDPSRYNFSTPGTYSPIGSEWMYASPWNFPYYGSVSHSQFFNFEQPCNWSRYFLYKDKTPRYRGVSSAYDLVQSIKDIMEEPNGATYTNSSSQQVFDGIRMSAAATEELVRKNENLTDLTLYQRCEKCPMAQDLELLLNAMIKNRTCNAEKDLINETGCVSSKVPIGCNNTTADYAAFTDDLEDLIGNAVGTGKLHWKVDQLTYNTTSQYWHLQGTFWLTGGSNPVCSLELRTPNGTLQQYDFSSITSFCCLKYQPDPQYLSVSLNKNFQITGIIPDETSPSGYKELVLEGVTSCINVTACTFEPVCPPSQEANDLMATFNALLNHTNPVPACTSVSTNALITVSSTSSCSTLTSLTNPGHPFSSAFSSLLRYKSDLTVCPDMVDVNASWTWETTYIGGAELIGEITTSAETCTPKIPCIVTLKILDVPPCSSCTDPGFTYIEKFVNIRPDPTYQKGTFLMDALYDDGTNRKYVTVRGSAPCYDFGTCLTDMPNAVRAASPLPRQLKCRRSEEGTQLMNELNANDGARISSTEDGSIDDGTEIEEDANLGCLWDDDCFEEIESDFNTYILPYFAARCSLQNNNNTSCSQNVRVYTFINHTGYPMLNGCLAAGDTIKLVWGPCCTVNFSVNQKCKITYSIFCEEEVNGQVVYRSAWSRELCGVCEDPTGTPGDITTTCKVQLEPLPAASGYSFSDVRGVQDLQPDPDRSAQDQGYFIIYLKMSDGNVLSTKGYSNCKKVGECGDCNTNEQIPNGDFVKGYDQVNYPLTSGYTNGAGSCPLTNEFVVPAATSNCNGGSPALTDHTGNASMFTPSSSPAGFMLLGAASATGKKLAWQKTMSVFAGEEYVFTMFYVNANASASLPVNDVVVEINGRTITQKKVEYNSNYTWQELSFRWIADDETAEIKIYNKVNATGNLVALDDISLRSVCACNDIPLAFNADFDDYDAGIDYTDVTSTLQLINETPANQPPPNPLPTAPPTNAKNYNIFTHYPTSSTDLKDHNHPGTGAFMVFKLETAPAIAWRQFVQVKPNTEYNFSAWFSSEMDDGLKVEMYVNNTLVTTATSGKIIAPDWFVLGGRWASANATTAELVIKVYNNTSGTNVYFYGLDDIMFRQQCQGGCDEQHYTEVNFDSPEDNCVEHLTNIAHHNAQIRYDEYLDGMANEFKEKYIAKCLTVYEEFLLREQDNGHHFTLYYYDQSGQLVRTVPPLGFKKITNPDSLKQIRIDRANGKRTVYSDHSMATTYTYNSLNQLVKQSVPDNDDMEIWDRYEYGATGTGVSGLNASSFMNNYMGSAVGATTSGFASIFKTANSGKDWDEIKHVNTGKPVALQMLGSSGIAYMITADQKLVYSSNSGQNWEIKNTLPLNHTWVGMFFSTTTNGDIIDENGQIYSTTNSGDTWTNSSKTITLGGGDKVKMVQMSSSTGYGIAIGTLGKIYRTNDGWTNTYDITLVRSVALTDVEMFDEDFGYAVGEDGTLLITENSGSTWKEIPGALTKKLTYAHFRSHKAGCVLDENGDIYATADQGVTWGKAPTTLNEGEEVAAMDFFNKLAGIAITKKGRLIGTLNGGLDWVKLGKYVPALDGTTDYFTTLDFVNSKEAFATDNNNKLYYVRYIMNDWYIVTCASCSLSLPSGVKAAKIQFSNIQKGTVLGTDELLYYVTTNLSLTPDDVPVTTISISTTATPLTYGLSGDEVADVRFVSGSLTYALTKYGELFQSTTQCSTWASVCSTCAVNTNTFTALAFEPVNNVVTAVSAQGEINTAPANTGVWSSTDYRVIPPLLNTINIVDASYTYISGADGTLLQIHNSTGKGNTIKTGTSEDLYAVAFSDVDRGIIGGTNGFAAYTYTTGSTWAVADFYTVSATPSPAKESLPVTATYQAALAVSSSEYYVAGTEGWMFKCNPTVTPPTSPWTFEDIHSNQYTLFMHRDANDKIVVGEKAGVVYMEPSATPPLTTWTAAASLLPSTLNDVQVMANNTGYAVGNNGNIIKTTDGGDTWTSIYSPTAQHLQAVHFVNEYMGYIAGNNGALFRTTNGGASWVDYSSPLSNSNHFNDLHFVGSNLAFICGAGNTVLHSNNPFAATPTWTNSSPTSLITGATFNAMHSADDHYGYLVGDNDVMIRYKYVRTSNTIDWEARLQNGSTPWAQYHTGASGVHITDVKFRDYYTGYVITSNGAILKTTDKGASWSLEKTQAGTPYYNSVTYKNLCMVDDHHLFLSGNGNNSQNFLYILDEKHEFSSRFYYDKLGRLTVSQNADQYARSTSTSFVYSYTRYDFKGRITEVGEIAADDPVESLFTEAGNRMDHDDYTAWVTSTGNTRTQVTKTYYDYQTVQPSGTWVNPSTFTYTSSIADNEYTTTFDNLRGRVSSITFENTDDGNNATYQYAMHYSYDVHGNVKSLVNEANIDLGTSGNRYVIKQVDYEYDLVSGKVNRVILNPWKKDKFLHRYEYDADNRITQVFTSHDGVIWQNDARYKYYLHGPLARTEVGNDNVQGLDYAYTLQGWLKGINSNTLVDPERDMGKDGFRPSSGTNPNRNFAPDEFGFTLHYFTGDYTPINSSVAAKHFEADIPGVSNLYGTTTDLYNGNISHMVTAIRQFMLGAGPGKKPQAMAYKYDQLNRLTATHKFQNVDLVDNEWGTNIALDDDYTETYEYDANGNILRLKRKGISNCESTPHNEIDDLVYKYEHSSLCSTVYTKKTNRLRAVLDQVSYTTAPGTNDIKPNQPWLTSNNPANDNYQYDRLGNLIKDVQEEIAVITWTTYGKIKSITRSTGSLKPDLEFGYDPGGNRVLKIVKPRNASGVLAQNYWKYTYYVRDAQGNTLANYNHFGDREYTPESYLLYGSSRIGEYLPRKYNSSCGENVDITHWADWEDAAEWAESYLKHLGYDVSYQTYWFNKWDNIPDALNTCDPKAVQAFVNAWMEWMCDTRCVGKEAMTTGYSDAFDTFWAERYAEANDEDGGFPHFNAIYMHNLENYAWPEAFDAFKEDNHSMFECNDCITHTYAKGSRHFELANHLGNVLATVSDRKIGVEEEYAYNPAATTRYLRNGKYTANADGDFEMVSASADNLVSEYLAEVISANDYYPFGMIMPGRTYTKPLSCSGSENCTAPEQVLMNGHAQSWSGYSGGSAGYNSVQDRQEITMTGAGSGAEYTMSGMPTSGESATVKMMVQAGTYNNVSVGIYDMGGNLVGSTATVIAGQNSPVSFTFPSSATQYKVRVTGANTANSNITPTWQGTSYWQSVGTGLRNYNTGTSKMEFTAYAANDGASINYNTPSTGQSINITGTLETGNNPVTVSIYDLSNNLLQTATYVTPNSSHSINLTVNNNTVTAHKLKLTGQPTVTPTPVNAYNDGFSGSWTAIGSAAPINHTPGTSVSITVNNYNDGAYNASATTPGNGNPLDFDLTIATNANAVAVEVYDPVTNNVLAGPVNVPSGQTTGYNLNIPLSNDNLTNYGVRTIGNPTPSTTQIVTNGESSLAWAAINTGNPVYSSPNLNIGLSNPGDGASANFTTTNGAAVSGSLSVTTASNPAQVSVFDNASNLVAGPYAIGSGTTSTVNFSFTATTTTYQIQVTTTGVSFPDNIAVTNFNVSETVLIPDNYTITSYTVTETQYIVTSDMFKLSNLSVTATPYPDVAYVTQLDVSYAKPYTRPLCSNNNDKLTLSNMYNYGFNGKERDDDIYGDGNSYDYGFRIYSPRIGRFLSVDPLTRSFAFLTPYQFASNSPIVAIDLDGLEAIVYTEGANTTQSGSNNSGHTVIVIQYKGEIYAYSYGRYTVNNNPSGAPGVLFKYTGKEAVEALINKEFASTGDYSAYFLPDANAENIYNHFENQLNSPGARALKESEMSPETKEILFDENGVKKQGVEAKVVDKYNVEPKMDLSTERLEMTDKTNTCGAKVRRALAVGEIKLPRAPFSAFTKKQLFKNSSKKMFANLGNGKVVDYSVHAIDVDLKTAAQNGSGVINVTGDKKKDPVGIFNSQSVAPAPAPAPAPADSTQK